MDIVDQILETIPLVKPLYRDWISCWEDDDGNLPDDISLETKLGSLGLALTSYAELPNFDPAHLKLALDMIEDFVKDADEETQGMVEIMFLEGFHWWAEDKEDEASKKYGDYALTCLGPTCRRLCKENDAYWLKINTQRQKAIDEKYAQMQKEYDERKKAEKE